jgi:hypothetical protein
MYGKELSLKMILITNISNYENWSIIFLGDFLLIENTEKKKFPQEVQ